jgi:hypothetical protein
MSIHVAWGSIELLHNVVIALTNLNKLQTVRYRAKVKLHGKNTAVQVNSDGLVVQSRTDILTPTHDLNGFAKWVAANEAAFLALPEGIVVFGEWAGPTVEKGMAISLIPANVFAIFCVQVGRGDNAHVVYEPEQIQNILKPVLACEGLHILPWEATEEIELDYNNKAQLQEKAPQLNSLVEQVEKEDPWVKRTFGISGLGEGLVFYPIVDGAQISPENLSHIMFKAKGDKHRTAASKESVQVDPTVVANTSAFVDLMVTEARLKQGVSEVCGGQYDMRNIATFLKWFAADVQKESVAELQASGLDWKQVSAPVQTRAREWYKERCLDVAKQC